MINWRDIRSQEQLKTFSAQFNALPQDKKDRILTEMIALLDAYREKDQQTPIMPRQVEVSLSRRTHRKRRGRQPRTRQV